MFPLLRHFSMASMVAILATSLLLAALHHLAERDQLLDLGEGNHVALAQTFANALLPSYRELADTTRSLDDAGLRAHPLVGDMRPLVIGAMQNTRVVKVKIYDRDGRTIFSTDISQIGKNYAGSPKRARQASARSCDSSSSFLSLPSPAPRRTGSRNESSGKNCSPATRAIWQ